MNTAIKAFLLAVVMQGVTLAEAALGGGKGEEKKKLALGHAESVTKRLGSVVGLGEEFGQREKDYTAWLVDNVVAVNNDAGVFKSSGKPKPETDKPGKMVGARA